MTKPFKILTAILPLYAIGCATSAVVTAPATESSPVEGQSKDFLYKLWAQGIDFYARGSEPFWSLDMDFDKQLEFKVLNDLNLSMPLTEGLHKMPESLVIMPRPNQVN